MKINLGSLFLGFILVVTMVSAISITIYPTTIRVDIFYDNGSIVKGADVVVTCNGLIGDMSEDVPGMYFAGFYYEECNESYSFDVVVSAGDYYGEVLNVSDYKFFGTDRLFSNVSVVVAEVDRLAGFSGVVYNESLNGSVIEGAEVNFSCGGFGASVLSDVNGSYYFEVLESVCDSDYEVSAVKDGAFDSVNGSVNFDAENVNDLVLVLAEDEEPEVYVNFSGVVYNSSLNGSVVEGANVSLSCGNVSEVGVSDVNGSYYFEFLESECNLTYFVEGVFGELNGTSGDLN